MMLKRMLIQVLLLVSLSLSANAEEAPAPIDSIGERGRFLLIPMRDPLVWSDATTMAWHSSLELFTFGGDALFAWSDLDNSFFGRIAHAALTFYFCHGINYYSHEIAHYSYNKGDQWFRLDFDDWTHLVPAYDESYDLFDVYDRDEYEYYQNHPYDTYILEWFTKSYEAGLYQTRFNSWFSARLATRQGATTLNDGLSYHTNAWDEFDYIRYEGDDEIVNVVTEHGIFLDMNDVNGYISLMNDLDIEISLDTWLAASGLSAALSGQSWNSLYSIYRFIVYGDISTRNIELGLGKRVQLAPPNFYLFPTVRGLYMETEVHLRGLIFSGDGTFVSFGSGLDQFGIDCTGPVDRMRMGARYFPAERLYSLSISPYVYADFTGDMKQIGHSLGVTIETPTYKRFFLNGTFEHNQRDMIEQVIKSKDDGFYFIAVLGFRM